MYLIAIQHTASVLVQCSALSGIISTLGESDPALMAGNDRTFPWNPYTLTIHLMTPQKAMKIASGRRQAGEGCCADSAAASSWEQPQHLDCSQPQNTALTARIDSVVGFVLPSHFQHKVKLICCPAPANWGYVFINGRSWSHHDTWHPLPYLTPKFPLAILPSPDQPGNLNWRIPL